MKTAQTRLRVKAAKAGQSSGGPVAHYDGASQSNRTSGWRRGSTDANAAVRQMTLQRLRDTARDLVRNNSNAKRAKGIISRNTIGTGLVPIFTGPKRVVAELEALFSRHMRSTSLDAEGLKTFRGIQSLCMKTIPESGEVLIRRRRRRTQDGLPMPFAVQVLEPDYLDSSVDGDLKNGNLAIAGIEFNRKGRRVAYHLFDEHPGGTWRGQTIKSRRVSASDMAHAFLQDRPGQMRGVPWFSAVILRIHNFDSFEDAQLVRQKVAQMFAAIVHDPAEAGYGPPANTGNAAADKVMGELNPGAILTLPPGKTIEFSDPPEVGGYLDFTKVTLQQIATGLDVPYEALTSDFGNVNFSSAKMAYMEFYKAIDEWQDDIVLPMICQPMMGWFLQAATLLGVNTDGVSVVWAKPKRPLIDASKEIPAMATGVRGGFMTLSNLLRQAGEDPEAHFQELANERERLNKLGVVVDTDPMHVSKSGVTQAQPKDGETYDGANDEDQ